MTRAGTPATRVSGSTSATTRDDAPTTAPAPTVTPGRIVARAPTQTPSPMTIGARSCSAQRWPWSPISCDDVRTITSGPNVTHRPMVTASPSSKVEPTLK
jgi:hypothetical protein